MAKEVIRQYLPLLEEEGRGAATDDDAAATATTCPNSPTRIPIRPGTAPARAAGPRSSTGGC